MSYNPAQSFEKGAFGELMIAKKTPIIQAAAQYGLGSKTRTLSNGTGASAGASDNLFFATSGTTTGTFASVFSKRSLSYKAGEGLLGLFTAMFDAAVDGQTQFAGLINATDALAFAYYDDGSGAEFGVLHRKDGQQEIQELQVTGTAGGAENATVTVDGTGYTVPLTAGTVQLNAKEIADSLNSQVPLWDFQQIDDTVVSRSLLSEDATGSFAFTSATATATWTKIIDGNAVTEIWYPQSSWNGEDPSQWATLEGVDLPFDPEKLNVYKIQTQYLGGGDIFCYIEEPGSGEFKLVHTIEYANQNTTTSFQNPSFRIGWSAGTRTGTTSQTIQGASYGLFVEGERIFTEEARSQFNSKTGLGASLTNILTIQSREVFGAKVNLAAVIPQVVTAETDSTKGAVVQVVKNAVLGGTTNYQYMDVDESIVIYDFSGTTVTNGQAVATFVLGPTGEKEIDLSKYNIELLPGETLTIGIAKLGGGTHDVSGSIVWQEDL